MTFYILRAKGNKNKRKNYPSFNVSAKDKDGNFVSGTTAFFRLKDAKSAYNMLGEEYKPYMEIGRFKG